jgi:tRNA threonylcarbamoyladenosine biosynthesis protein TsaB
MWLALDTATDQASVALGTGEADAQEENLAGARQHASRLLTMIESLLRQRGVGVDAITGLVVSDGPGSFTGLRVGAAVAKALVRSRGLPLWTAPSLLVRAAGAAAGSLDEGAAVVAIANALRGEVFAAAYRFTPAAIVTVSAPSVWRPEALRAALDEAGIRPQVVVGDVPDDAAAVLDWGARPVLPPAGAPRARQLIGLIGRRGGATRVDDVAGWEPTYGRPAEAQVRWEAMHGRALPHTASGSLGRL